MLPRLVIFSGLPGTGKSTLANQLARELRWPLLRLDDLVVQIPAGAGPVFWDEKILVLLTLAEAQLELGLSVMLDSVFMGSDRLHAQELARRYAAAFRPVYCFVSDETLWERRVSKRFEKLNHDGVASWERIMEQRKYFRPWEPDSALFLDAARPLEQNFAALLEYVTGPEVHLHPLALPDTPLTKGSYHA